MHLDVLVTLKASPAAALMKIESQQPFGSGVTLEGVESQLPTARVAAPQRSCLEARIFTASPSVHA